MENERGFVNSKMDKVLNFIEGLPLSDVANVTTEMGSRSDAWNGCGDHRIDEFQES